MLLKPSVDPLLRFLPTPSPALQRPHQLGFSLEAAEMDSGWLQWEGVDWKDSGVVHSHGRIGESCGVYSKDRRLRLCCETDLKDVLLLPSPRDRGIGHTQLFTPPDAAPAAVSWTLLCPRREGASVPLLWVTCSSFHVSGECVWAWVMHQCLPSLQEQPGKLLPRALSPTRLQEEGSGAGPPRRAKSLSIVVNVFLGPIDHVFSHRKLPSFWS